VLTSHAGPAPPLEEVDPPDELDELDPPDEAPLDPPDEDPLDVEPLDASVAPLDDVDPLDPASVPGFDGGGSFALWASSGGWVPFWSWACSSTGSLGAVAHATTRAEAQSTIEASRAV
jgi:hypothetical protein